MPDLKQHAQQIVSTWPKLTSAQQAVVGSVMRRD